MKIGIIGAGHIGTTLTKRFTALGHEVNVANSRDPDTLVELASQTGATAVYAADAAQGADVVVITIPVREVPNLPKDILDKAAVPVAVIDTCNYYPSRDGKIEAIEAGTTESRWVADQLGHTVVKVFNGIRAQHLLDLGKPAGSADRIALPVAADDEDAKSTVMKLVDELGFDPVDAGSLDESWRQQPGTPVYGTDLDAEGVREALRKASAVRAPDFIG